MLTITFILICGSLVVSTVLFAFPFGYFSTSGPSMLPTIPEAGGLLVENIGSPEVGDIVIFRCEVKACNYPGNRWDVINYTKRIEYKKGNCYYFLGDNPPNSYDSRDYGWLCEGKDFTMLGTVIYINP